MPRNLPKPFTPDERRALSEAFEGHPREKAALAFLSYTGLRIAEACSITRAEALSWPQPGRWCRKRCRKHRAVLRIIGKGRKERVVALSPDALRAARVLLRSPGRNGRAELLLPWTDRGYRKALAKIGQSVGVHAHPHRARHSFITALVEADVPIEVVAALAGHSSVDTTRIYYEMSERRAFEALASVR